MQVQFLGQKDNLKQQMATYSSISGWKIPWVEEPGGLQFRLKIYDNVHTHTHTSITKTAFVVVYSIIMHHFTFCILIFLHPYFIFFSPGSSIFLNVLFYPMSYYLEFNKFTFILITEIYYAWYIILYYSFVGLFYLVIS